MATIVDEYLDGQSTDNEDVFPCKGCGEILEEGKAFELAGNRWHLDCFRCNTCGTLLDSDANLLLLGDGSLICNNCTYSCSACGNKIEDLAILTGDQAFCSTCFRCRNCKRKIDNLRYARTSQGIFCMQCHETLMARRKKKSKAAAAASAAKARDKDQSPMVTEKSLPALPPNVIPNGAFSNDRVDPDAPTELSPRPHPTHKHTDSSRGGSRPPEHQAKPDGLGLTHTHSGNRNSTVVGNESGGDDGFFIPVALDPSPAPSTTPQFSAGGDSKKDHFGIPKSSFADKRSDSRSSTPHIAFQENGRQPSDHSVSQAGSLTRNLSRRSRKDEPPQPTDEGSHGPSPRPRQAMDDFKLQDAPRGKKQAASLSSSSSPSESAASPPGLGGAGIPSSSGSRRPSEGVSQRPSPDVKSSEQPDEVGPSPDPSSRQPRSENPKAISRKEIPRNNIPRKSVGEGDRPQPLEGSEQRDPSSYMKPRTAPVPPGAPREEQEDGEEKVSPKLPRWSSGGDFTLDEDMARILGTDQGSSSLLKRASNMARHGRAGSIESAGQLPHRASHARSASETTRGTLSPAWQKDPLLEEQNGRLQDVASPTSLSSGEDPAILRRQLRSSEQRVAELERQFNTEKDLKNLNKKLIEKRKTVSVLDTQTEVMIRQLEVLAGYVEKAKETKTPVDPRELEDSAIRDFVQKLENVKLTMSEGIEQLHVERDRILEEKNNALADRDRALMEFEQLSSKNAQLADMNNDLTQQLQGRFKNSSMDGKALNGLGIYGDGKMGGGSSVNLDATSTTTGPTLVAADDDAFVEAGPTVVQVRKGQVKKFNWKKGSKGLAQNVAKGVNRAVVAFQQNDRGERIPTMPGGDIGLPYNTTVTAIESPAPPGPSMNMAQARQVDHGRHQGFGFFSKKHAVPKSQSASAVVAPAIADASTTLFGSDLTERAEFEHRQIPSVVIRCIEEVELRGMNQEGIYRKTGGNSQVNMIKEGFDKDENFDISDPDLDITAVTSVLKQYFRKLPIPLLTYDVYDRVLESTAIPEESDRCDFLRKTFDSMPEKHRDCLEFLMFHLDRVAQRQSENLMTPKNLAVVFAPTIMFERSIEREMTDMHAKNLAVQFVIENSRNIFAEA